MASATASARPTVRNSTLSGNSADRGGGIANFGTLTVQNSTLSGNCSVRVIWAYQGTLTVDSSTLSGNYGGIDGQLYHRRPRAR